MRHVPTALLALLLLSCSAQPPEAYETLQSLALRDVQGLSGGRDLYLTADTAVLVVVEPSKRARRYTGRLSPEEWTELQDMLRSQRFLQIVTPARSGVPDEARPSIEVRLADGRGAAIAKWQNDTQAGFDAVYGWLLERARNLLAHDELAHTGTYRWSWRPDGFESSAVERAIDGDE